MTTSPRAEPHFFGPSERPIFGWLHRAAAPHGDLGLVICNPFGHEAQNIHRSLRHFAESSAAIGISALRFDFDGTGDSGGDDTDSERLAVWINSIHRAVELLREATGVTRVALLGVRLGALLAALAASKRDDVCGLALIAPVVTGKAWLREMRALHGALALNEPPHSASPLPDGAREAVGFLLSAETIAALSEVDLTSLEKRPASCVLLLDRDDLPGSARLAAHFEFLGAQVDQRTLPGYADMMQDPHNSHVPDAMIEAITDWLCAQIEHSGEAEPPSPLTKGGRLLGTRGSAVIGAVQEHAVFLDDEKRLFGIVSVPQGGQPKRAIVLVNAGANHRVGPNRLYVKLARRWAERGYLVLRFDIAGIGDSLPHTGEAEHIVYPPRAASDISTAINYLQKKWGVETCRVAGLCSGGYHAFQAALAGALVDDIVFINPLTFRWKPGTSLDLPASHDISEAARYRQSMLQGDKWKRLLRGETNMATVVGVVARRGVGAATRRISNTARRVGYTSRDDLGAQLESLARRGTALHFVFAEGDPGLALLHEQGGPAVARLVKSGRLTIESIAGPDHTFTPLWSHERLADTLDAAIE